jgi:hypothetical protein
MMPVNGVAGKPAKTTTRRATSKMVVPVLPLNYPQRPANRQQMSAPVAPPPTNGQTTSHATEEKPASDPQKCRQELPVKTSAELGPSSANNLNTVPTSAPPVQATTIAELSGPAAAASEERAKEGMFANAVHSAPKTPPSSPITPPTLHPVGVPLAWSRPVCPATPTSSTYKGLLQIPLPLLPRFLTGAWDLLPAIDLRAFHTPHPKLRACPV